MQPIVNGLETKYAGTIEFRKINAGTEEGVEIISSYGMFGHPSYLILDERGQVIWEGIGEQPAENLEDAILNMINKAGGI